MSFTVGVDVGGTKVLGGVVDEFGKVHKMVRRDTPRAGGAELISVIAAVANELREDFQVDAVGVSAAGFVSSDRKTILATPNIANWNGVNLNHELTTLIGLPIDIENDANSAAWAEARFGSGQGKSEILMLTVGTGIGGGVITNGELRRGAFGIAAEIGHMRVVPDGQACGCGAQGCFEQYASGSALMRYAREAIASTPDAAHELLARGDGTVEGLTGTELTQGAQDGDPIAILAFHKTADWLGAGIASLCAILDPECVIIGGGVIEAGEILLGPTRESLDRNMPFSRKHPHPQIIAASLGNNAGLVGVADLARR